ncbi:hypothetical protein [Streptomyces sp. NPDC047042]|uniref:hypothetical protein n=1 Tax=Streptomyces sp. NPDC047042 TaxID=3154807 RepID=UPI0034082C25
MPMIATGHPCIEGTRLAHLPAGVPGSHYITLNHATAALDVHRNVQISRSPAEVGASLTSGASTRETENRVIP